MFKYPFIRPTLPDIASWTPHLKESYESRYFSNFGPAARQFERAIEKKFSLKNKVVSVGNCTVGLTAALLAMGVRGKVVVPSFTFAATAQAVLQAGCTPVFCDIDEESWLMCSEHLKSIIKHQKIAAIMPVRSFGFNSSLSQIRHIARDANIPLIVDAAPAFGDKALLEDIDQSGVLEVFSCHATKVFGIGEGGVAIVPEESEGLFRRCLNFGIDNYEVEQFALNGKMSDFSASVGISALKTIDDFILHRRLVASRYMEALSEEKAIEKLWPSTYSVWQTYPVLLCSENDPEELLRECKLRGLELRRYYFKPLHLTKAFAPYSECPLPCTEKIAEKIVCLPVYSDLQREEQQEIIELLTGALETCQQGTFTQKAVSA